MIEKDEKIYQLIKEVLLEYGDRHNVTATEYFAPMLGFRGKNAQQQLINALNTTSFNPSTPKRLSLDQIGVLLKELDETGRRSLLERINNYFGYGTMLVRQGVDIGLDVLSVFDTLLELDEKHGDLAKIIRDAISDGEIDQDECKNIKAGARRLRQMAAKLEEIADASCKD